MNNNKKCLYVTHLKKKKNSHLLSFLCFLNFILSEEKKKLSLENKANDNLNNISMENDDNILN